MSPQSNAPAAAADAVAVAEQAAEEFLGALRSAIDRLPKPPKLDGPAARLRDALEAIGANPEPVLAAADSATGAYWLGGAPTDEVRRTDAGNRLPAVVAAVDQALTSFPGQANLDAARAKVRRLNAERTRVLTELEQAVAAADVEQVLRLRPRIEVELPAALDDARLEVAELELARVEHERGRPVRRAERADVEEQAAQSELEKARQRVTDAQAEAERAALARFTADALVAQTEQRARQLAAEVDRLREANAESLSERLRRLAGLPPETAGPDAADRRVKAGAR